MKKNICEQVFDCIKDNVKFKQIQSSKFPEVEDLIHNIQNEIKDLKWVYLDLYEFHYLEDFVNSKKIEIFYGDYSDSSSNVIIGGKNKPELFDYSYLLPLSLERKHYFENRRGFLSNYTLSLIGENYIKQQCKNMVAIEICP